MNKLDPRKSARKRRRRKARRFYYKQYEGISLPKLVLVNPELAYREVLIALAKADFKGSEAASILGVSYLTLRQVMSDLEELANDPNIFPVMKVEPVKQLPRQTLEAALLLARGDVLKISMALNMSEARVRKWCKEYGIVPDHYKNGTFDAIIRDKRRERSIKVRASQRRRKRRESQDED